MASREGDFLTTGHGCDGITNLAISLVRTVKANGINVAVLGTPTVPHAAPPSPLCPAHVKFLNQGSLNVRASNIPIGRLGHSADGGVMITGSTNVLVNGR